MTERYAVRNVVFASGERFPMLIDVLTGIPLLDPTVFVLTQVRARNRASATIEMVLRTLKLFQLFCDQHQIDLTQRMAVGQLLDMGELEALVRLCRLPIIQAESRNAIPTGRGRAPVSLETYRGRSQRIVPEVASHFAGVHGAKLNERLRKPH